MLDERSSCEIGIPGHSKSDIRSWVHTHVGHRRLMVAPFLNGEAFEENKALAVEDFGSY
jgi:hypothetical protein